MSANKEKMAEAGKAAEFISRERGDVPPIQSTTVQLASASNPSEGSRVPTSASKPAPVGTGNPVGSSGTQPLPSSAPVSASDDEVKVAERKDSGVRNEATSVPPSSGSRPSETSRSSTGTGHPTSAGTGSSTGTGHPTSAGTGSSAGTGTSAGNGEEQLPSSPALAPAPGGEAKGVEGKEGRAEGMGATPRPVHRCGFAFGRRVCALPAVRGAAALLRRRYDAVKRTSPVAGAVMSAAECLLRLAVGPAVLCAVPMCVAMAIPVCVADFGLNRALDAVVYVAPCVEYDFEKAKEAAVHLALRVVTLPESAAGTVAVLLDTCPGKAIVKAVQLTSEAAGKTCDVLIFCPKDAVSAVNDTVFLIPRLSWNMTRRLAQAAENGRKALRDRLAAAAVPHPADQEYDEHELSLYDRLAMLAES